jgi:dienelactone hydrolase
MQRLAWLTVALLLVSGCESGTSQGPAAIDFTPGPPPTGQGFVALYAPPVDVGPYPNNLYNPVAAGTGSTLAVPEKITIPLAAGLNTLDGFSTTAVITAPFNAPIDPATVEPFDIVAPTGTETVFVLDATNGVPLRPSVDYEARISTTTGTFDSLLEIEPIVPLAPQTTYAFFLTSGIESELGVAAEADLVFGAVRDAHLAGLTSVPGVPELDPLFPAIAPLIDAGVGLLGLPGDAIVSAWSMTTQSITDVLDTIEASAAARPATLVPTGFTTADVSPSLPGIADIYAGFIEIPYYGDTQDVLGSFWVTANLVPPTGADPVPMPRVPSLRIPMIATLPNAMSMQPKPMDGWPVVIYQHGVTLDRTTALAIADSFASQGFAVVAIDLPLHGVRDATSPLYQGPGNATNPFGNNERHFYLDNIDAVGRPIPDGEIDDGRQLFNVANPVNARDHIRQAVSDLIHLTRTIPTLDFDGGGADLDAARIHHVGMSLGSAFSSVLLGLNSEIRSATMSSPFATWSRILTDPEAVTFGAPVRAGLAAEGLTPGTVNFANFVRDLQTILDSAEPANYAQAATALHPLHVIEVLGDQSVPNGPTDYIAGLWGAVDVLASEPPLVDPGGAHGIVRFTSGNHGSLLDPTADPAVTTEMQTQMVTFAATDGTTIAINDTSVVQ